VDMFNAVMIAEGAEGYEVESKEEYLEAWQFLVDTGVCWTLQGWFGRTAAGMIESGEINAKGAKC